MLGWEFPPYFAGGVGTVCFELTKALARKGVDIIYVMPSGPESVHSQHLRLIVAHREAQRLGIRIRTAQSKIAPYLSTTEYSWHRGVSLLNGDTRVGALYGKNLLEEMDRFSQEVLAIAEHEEFDVIHAHDWTTIPAALALKERTGKPLVLHVHITEFDKTGGEHADPTVYNIEHQGMHHADIVIAISNFVKQRLIRQYFVDPAKIRVVYNSVDSTADLPVVQDKITDTEKLVLFLGRVTLQKGPDYFLDAAAKVANVMPNVKFVIAGTGDMLPRMIERAADLGLGSRVIFPGFVTREEGDRLYRMADLFVMPSVSEPFGIVPLEAMRLGTPVIVSRQSGVSEVIQHALKVDFWDTDDLANKMIAGLTYSALHNELIHHGYLEIQRFTWETPAESCMRIYEELKKRVLVYAQ